MDTARNDVRDAMRRLLAVVVETQRRDALALQETADDAGLVRAARLGRLTERTCPPAACGTVTWREQEARNEVRFREQNEWIDSMSRSFGLDGLRTFVCECGDGACVEPIEMTKVEYESVRSESRHFALALDHENPEMEHVVTEFARYAVVQKFDVFAVRLAREYDPRR